MSSIIRILIGEPNKRATMEKLAPLNPRLKLETDPRPLGAYLPDALSSSSARQKCGSRTDTPVARGAAVWRLIEEVRAASADASSQVRRPEGLAAEASTE